MDKVLGIGSVIQEMANNGTRIMTAAEIVTAAAAESLQSCPTLCDPTDGSPPGSHPWDSPGRNTGMGCHFLLQCMKVKSESEITQSCLTLCDPKDCSPSGSSVHGILQARVLDWVASAFSDGNSSSGYYCCYSSMFLQCWRLKYTSVECKL